VLPGSRAFAFRAFTRFRFILRWRQGRQCRRGRSIRERIPDISSRGSGYALRLGGDFGIWPCPVWLGMAAEVERTGSEPVARCTNLVKHFDSKGVAVAEVEFVAEEVDDAGGVVEFAGVFADGFGGEGGFLVAGEG
jgi:hypothetical protein